MVEESTDLVESERRRYFRISDHVGLDLQRIAESDRVAALEGFEASSNRFGLLNQLRALRDRNLPERRRIQHKFPSVAAYIDVLEQQIECLAQVLTDNEPVLARANTQVDLSAQGLGFQTDETFAVDDMLEVRLVLFPDASRIKTIARVVKVDTCAAGLQVAIEFVHLRDADREAIVKHVHLCQLQQLRANAKDAG